jgi:hypothetical protein
MCHLNAVSLKMTVGLREISAKELIVIKREGMKAFDIESGIPFQPLRRGRKKGVRILDNEALIRRAALCVINNEYKNSNQAAKALMSQFKTTSGDEASKITMFRKAILNEIKCLQAKSHSEALI